MTRAEEKELRNPHTQFEKFLSTSMIAILTGDKTVTEGPTIREMLETTGNIAMAQMTYIIAFTTALDNVKNLALAHLDKTTADFHTEVATPQ